MVRCFPTEVFAACVNLIQHCCSVSGSCLGGLEFPACCAGAFPTGHHIDLNTSGTNLYRKGRTIVEKNLQSSLTAIFQYYKCFLRIEFSSSY